MKEFVTITWQRSDGMIRSSITLLCRDMVMASMISAQLGEMAKQIQALQGSEIEDPNIIPGLMGHA